VNLTQGYRVLARPEHASKVVRWLGRRIPPAKLAAGSVQVTPKIAPSPHFTVDDFSLHQQVLALFHRSNSKFTCILGLRPLPQQSPNRAGCYSRVPSNLALGYKRQSSRCVTLHLEHWMGSTSYSCSERGCMARVSPASRRACDSQAQSRWIECSFLSIFWNERASR
jgi:hypothetical protein